MADAFAQLQANEAANTAAVAALTASIGDIETALKADAATLAAIASAPQPPTSAELQAVADSVANNTAALTAAKAGIDSMLAPPVVVTPPAPAPAPEHPAPDVAP